MTTKLDGPVTLRWTTVLSVVAAVAFAGSVEAQGLRSATSHITLLVVKPGVDETARTTRDFSGPAPRGELSLVVVDARDLPQEVIAFIRGATGRLMRLGDGAIPVDPGQPVLVRLQGPQGLLKDLSQVQVNARAGEHADLVLSLTGSSPAGPAR